MEIIFNQTIYDNLNYADHISKDILYQIINSINIKKPIIILSSDHHGYKLKRHLIKNLSQYNLIEITSLEKELKNKKLDYTKISILSCQLFLQLKPLLNNEIYLVLICNNGAGVNIVANKFKGIRSVVCSNINEAKRAKTHGNCNAISLANNTNNIFNKFPFKSFINSFNHKEKIVKAFISTSYKNQYDNRLKDINNLENKVFK